MKFGGGCLAELLLVERLLLKILPGLLLKLASWLSILSLAAGWQCSSAHFWLGKRLSPWMVCKASRLQRSVQSVGAGAGSSALLGCAAGGWIHPGLAEAAPLAGQGLLQGRAAAWEW